MTRHCSISCILPPYMLEEIMENGSPEQRQSASRTAQVSEQIREERQEERAKKVITPSVQLAGLQRRVYTALHLSNLPGQLVRAEGAPPAADDAVNEAYDGAGSTYNLFMDIYQRDSIDGAGMVLDSTVHYQVGYDNAFWNGSQMVYGDGDENLPPAQRLFNRFTSAIDVIGHELTHGVTQYTGNLTYSFQSGAMNESFSDVFGSLVKQRLLGHTSDQADWIIGEGLFTSNVNGVGIRSMKAPGTAYDDPVLGKDPQPDHMDGYVTTTSDNGGVHINSGIPNRAFYLAAVEMGGFAWEKAGRIWYVTLRDRIKPTSNFQASADLTYTVAGELYGLGGPEQLAVQHGWAGVGITVGQTTPPPDGGDENPGCLPALMNIFKRR